MRLTIFIIYVENQAPIGTYRSVPSQLRLGIVAGNFATTLAVACYDPLRARVYYWCLICTNPRCLMEIALMTREQLFKNIEDYFFNEGKLVYCDIFAAKTR